MARQDWEYIETSEGSACMSGPGDHEILLFKQMYEGDITPNYAIGAPYFYNFEAAYAYAREKGLPQRVVIAGSCYLIHSGCDGVEMTTSPLSEENWLANGSSAEKAEYERRRTEREKQGDLQEKQKAIDEAKWEEIRKLARIMGEGRKRHCGREPFGDSQGIIYCSRCHEFLGLESGQIEHYREDGQEVSEGWGYLLNGPDWTAELLAAIKTNHNKYNDHTYKLMNQMREAHRNG